MQIGPRRPFSRRFGLAVAIASIGGAAGCRTPAHPWATPAETPASPPSAAVVEARPNGPRFSGEAALARVETLMALPRTLGDPRRTASIEALVRMLEQAGAATVEQQAFVAHDVTTGEPYALVNLIAHLRPAAARRFVLATHFDTRPWADEEPDPARHAEPVPGANDGTSGVAVLLELMPGLDHALPPDVGVTVILFDGEELGRPGTSHQGGYCMGSRHFAAQAAKDPPAWLPGAQLGIVLDMVGDADLHVLVEPGSAARAPALVRTLWDVAARRGHTQLEDRVRPVSILDDHVFLTAAGVPSILVIDHEYDAWHTRRDTLDRVSAASLHAVGDTVLYTLLELAATPAP
jgi:glutaminyl-peptide cyclotransferase